MPHRRLLTDAQRANLLALPTREATLIRHFTLAEEDLALVATRKHPGTKLGLALQLCALRYHRLRRSVCEAAGGKAARGAACCGPAS